MPSSTLTSKGQTTIPREVRDHLKLHSGDQIDFIIQTDGSVLVRPATVNVSELKGMLHRKNMKAVSVDEMSDAVRTRFRRTR
jgi:AbrB family looped-hinge helix DNA binding protein